MLYLHKFSKRDKKTQSIINLNNIKLCKNYLLFWQLHCSL